MGLHCHVVDRSQRDHNQGGTYHGDAHGEKEGTCCGAVWQQRAAEGGNFGVEGILGVGTSVAAAVVAAAADIATGHAVRSSPAAAVHSIAAVDGAAVVGGADAAIAGGDDGDPSAGGHLRLVRTGRRTRPRTSSAVAAGHPQNYCPPS